MSRRTMAFFATRALGMSEETNVARGTYTECWADAKGLFYTPYQSAVIAYDDGTPSPMVPGCAEATHCP